MHFRHILALATGLCAGPLTAAELIGDDLLVLGDACIGTGCLIDSIVAGDDLRLASGVPILYFEDTTFGSLSNGRDWRMFVNNNILSIQDDPLTSTFVFARMPTLVGEAFGIGAPVPQQHLHIRAVDTPTIRLDQNGQSSVVWETGANEENYFIRDAVAGTLPFRIRPGAPTNALFVDANGQVGVGLQNPRGALHVRRNQPTNVPHLVLQNRREGGRTELWFEDRDTATDDDALRLQLRGDDFNITFNGTGGAEFRVSKTGDVRIFRGDLVISNGGVIVGGSTLNVPDYVFAEDYELMPLSDVAAFIDEHSHLPHIPSAAEIAAHGLDMTDMQLAMLKTIEEQMLHTLDLQRQVNTLMAEVNRLSAALE